MNIETLRMVERLVIDLFAGLSMVLGYKLFTLGIIDPQKGDITLSKYLKMRSAQFGPGIFFAFFGAWILTVSLYNKVSFEKKDSNTTEPTHKAGSTAGNASSVSISAYGSTEDFGFDPLQRIKTINAMENHAQDYLSRPEGSRAREILRAEKIALLKLEWPNSSADLNRFLNLLETGQTVPPSDETLNKMQKFYEATFP